MLAVLILPSTVITGLRADPRGYHPANRPTPCPPGTKAILKKLDTPVKIRFYCTQSETADA
jgi:hypothetical protein